MRLKVLLAKFLLTVSLLVSVASGQPREIAAFFSNQGGGLAALSSDGKRVVFSEQKGDILLLNVLDLDTNKKTSISIDKTGGLLTYLGWKGERIIFSNGKAIWSVLSDGSKALEIFSFNEANSSAYSRLQPILPTHRSIVHGPEMSAGEPRPPFGADDDREYNGSDRSLLSEGADGLGSQDEAFRVVGAAHADFFSAQVIKEGRVRIPVVADLLPENKKQILVEIRDLAGPFADAARHNAADLQCSLVLVDVASGDHTLEEGQSSTIRLQADRQGKARLSVDVLDDERSYSYSKGKAAWRKLDKTFKELGSTEITPQTFLGPRTIPLSFDYDGKTLYFASSVGRDTFGIYALDTTTGKRSDLAIEQGQFDMVDFAGVFSEQNLVFDEHRKVLVGARFYGWRRLETVWFDDELARVQSALEESVPGRVVVLQSWDSRREKFLVFISGQSDPGAFYIADPKNATLLQLIRKAPALASDQANLSTAFTFKSPAGVALSGFVTLPRTPRIKPPPLLVYLHDGPWSRDLPGFNRGAQALAEMGFAVLQINYRGSSGFGFQFMNAIKNGVDRVPLEDVFDAIDWVGRAFKVNTKHCAFLGEGFGGYLALRAAQLRPESLRCVVAINAPTSLSRWALPMGANQRRSFRVDSRSSFFGLNHQQLVELSPVYRASTLQLPVLLIHEAVNRDIPVSHSRELAAKLKDQGTPVKFLEVSSLGDWRTEKYAKVFGAMEAFFNEYIYDYLIKVPESKVISSEEPVK